MVDVSRCAVCGTPGPEPSTVDTQWSKYGWRISRRVDDAGAYVVELLCPTCWKARKEAARAAQTTPKK